MKGIENRLNFQEKGEVLLISPKINTQFTKNYNPKLTENLGLAYIAGYLESKNIPVTVVDLNSSELDFDGLVRLALKNNYFLIGISGNSSFYLSNAINFSKVFREKGVKSHITLGGHKAAFGDLSILKEHSSVDSIVREEGEITSYKMYDALKKGKSMKGILGVTYREDDAGIRKNPKREPINDLDSLPLPKHYNLKAILNSQDAVHLITSRGCPGRCSFCVIPLSGRWRSRSAGNVMEELSELYWMGVRNFVIDDENYTGHCKKGRERAIEIAESIVKRGMNIKYKVSFRVDDITDELLDIMILSGLSRINLGVESFNQRQLDFFNKRITPEQSIKAMEKIMIRNLPATLGFMMFDPYVTLDELQNNHTGIKRFSRLFNFKKVRSFLKPVQGSVAWETIKKDGLLIEEEDFNDFYKFQYEASGKVFEMMEDTRIKMSELESKYETFIENYAELIKKDKDFAKAFRKDVENRMITMWLDILQNSISCARTGTKMFEIPFKIKEQHDLIAKILN